MNKKEQQMQRERQEDVVLNKVLWWIVGAVVLEFLLLLLNRFYSYYTPDGIALAQALRTVFTVLGIVLPLCFLALHCAHLASLKVVKQEIQLPVQTPGVITQQNVPSVHSLLVIMQDLA